MKIEVDVKKFEDLLRDNRPGAALDYVARCIVEEVEAMDRFCEENSKDEA